MTTSKRPEIKPIILKAKLKVAVLGGGSWATALIKILIENKRKVGWYIRNEKNKEFIEKFINKKNSFYKNDDFIDSCSLFWSAKRVVNNNEIQIPNKIIRDVKGIIMQMKI